MGMNKEEIKVTVVRRLKYNKELGALQNYTRVCTVQSITFLYKRLSDKHDKRNAVAKQKLRQ